MQRSFTEWDCLNDAGDIPILKQAKAEYATFSIFTRRTFLKPLDSAGVFAPPRQSAFVHPRGRP